MGIYDRAYYRDEPRSGLLGSRSMVTNLVLLNVAIFLVDYFGRTSDSFHLQEALALDPTKLWQVWRFVTYGFAHESGLIMHVGFNMFGLWMFGREMEDTYGKAEFLRFYLTAIVLAGLIWLGLEFVKPADLRMPLVGASGGVTAVVLLWVLNFPKRTILFNFFIPMPAWLMGALFIFIGIVGATDSRSTTAHSAHLTGAAFAFLYHHNRWNLGKWLPSGGGRFRFRWRPHLKLHNPVDQEKTLSQQVDRILQKLHNEGEASLTRKERSTLEEASRRYQQRRE